MGLNQRKKTRLSYHDFLSKIAWIRGKYQPIFWEAYKSGLWTRDERRNSPGEML